MSDQMADKKEAEVEQQKTAEQQAQEEQQERLWGLTILVDPATWEVVLSPNKNVTKQGQLDAMLELARKQIEVNTLAKVVASITSQVVAGNKPKGLFKR